VEDYPSFYKTVISVISLIALTFSGICLFGIYQHSTLEPLLSAWVTSITISWLTLCFTQLSFVDDALLPAMPLLFFFLSFSMREGLLHQIPFGSIDSTDFYSLFGTYFTLDFLVETFLILISIMSLTYDLDEEEPFSWNHFAKTGGNLDEDEKHPYSVPLVSIINAVAILFETHLTLWLSGHISSTSIVWRVLQTFLVLGMISLRLVHKRNQD